MLPGVVLLAPLAFWSMAMRSSSRMGAASPNAVSMGEPPSVCEPRAAGTSPVVLQSIVRRRSICCRSMRPACATAGGRGAACFRRFCSLSSFGPQDYTHTPWLWQVAAACSADSACTSVGTRGG